MKPCEIWQGQYEVGRCMLGRKNVARMRYSELHGEIPKGYRVYRSCKNSRCVEPSHLYIAIYGNYRPKSEFNYPDRRGEDNAHAKLTADEIVAIREMYFAGYSLRSVGRQFKISHSHVSRIVNHVSWEHV